MRFIRLGIYLLSFILVSVMVKNSEVQGGSLKICEDEIFGVLSVLAGDYSFRRTREYQTKFWSIDACISNKDKCHRPIALIIESPHIKEFEGVHLTNTVTEQIVKARPVNGATGVNLLQQLGSLFKKLPVQLGDGNYPVLIINAIQLQCSRGADTLIYRTRDFIHYWPSYRSSFINRLSRLAPSFVINACTKGDFYITNEKGEIVNIKAYNSGFDVHFKQLLNKEFGYRQVNSGGELQFMGSFDLSGLVMHQLHDIYKNNDIKIYKTAHPASWGFRAPNFTNYSDKCFEFSRT